MYVVISMYRYSARVYVIIYLFCLFVFLLVVNSLHQTHTSNVIQLASIRFYAWKHFLSFFCFAHHNDGEEVNRGRICGLTEGSGSTQKKVIESLWLLLLLDVARAKLKTENGSTNSDWRKWHSVNAMRGDWACLLIYSCFFLCAAWISRTIYAKSNGNSCRDFNEKSVEKETEREREKQQVRYIRIFRHLRSMVQNLPFHTNSIALNIWISFLTKSHIRNIKVINRINISSSRVENFPTQFLINVCFCSFHWMKCYCTQTASSAPHQTTLKMTIFYRSHARLFDNDTRSNQQKKYGAVQVKLKNI